ncbi:hypothetical protein FXF51_44805 [Nonomuraea sp. PA05]|uniref:hypothetical protein n=1 Tax=Nonomuraea sp. PA05 TaxID=2604466 RepID=UPI0011D8BDD6|nr:hypothetical protein [Nonomuraea sp. PA05]TYB56225.1 hypothetical protein FXF51_44805 [Nonomuraea sp. PA05]
MREVPRTVRNPEEHDLPAIRASIEAFGVVVASELDERTGRLVVGHGRLQILKEMAAAGESPPESVLIADDGTWLPPIVRGWSSRSDADAEAYLTANNPHHREGQLGGADARRGPRRRT